MRESCKPVTVIPLGGAAIGVLFLVGVAFGIPCKGEVTLGDTLEQVAENCGAATLKDHRELWEEEADREGKALRTTSIVDEWTFDLGPEQLMRTFFFQDGRLSGIRSMGYGRIQDPMMDNCQNGESLAIGDSALEAYLKCGEPLAKEKRGEKVTETLDGEQSRRSAVPVVEWIYRYGPKAPGYAVRFENGQATEIRTREFGK